MADKKFNIKDQLAGVAALIAAIVAIGGGFAKYGELTTKITALEAASKKVDKVSIEMVAVLQEKVAALENKEEVNAGPTEGLGLWASGGGEKKPHSTWKGRMEAGKNWYNRAWGQKHFNKKKKGIPV